MSKHELSVDPEFAKLLIPLAPDEYALLEKSLLRDGCRDPLVAWRWDGKLILLDGHNRLEICERLGIHYKVVTVEIESREMAKIWIRRNQLARRNLPDDARAMMGSRLLKDLSRLAREQQLAEARQAKADRRSGKKASVSTTAVDTEKKAKKDNLAEVAKAGGISQRRVRLAGKIEDRAVAVMGAAAAGKVCDEIAQGRLSLARAKRDLSKAEDRKKREAAKALDRPDKDRCYLRHMRMQQFLPRYDGLIDAIITDPPYVTAQLEYLPLYGELARLSVQALKPNGVLAVMIGQSYLPEILAAMTQHIKYRWEIAYLTPGPSTAVWGNANANSQHKLVLIFGGEKRIVDDVVYSDAEDKSFHEWGQSESGMCRLVERLSNPDALICDPFLGAGTTAVAAIRSHCRIVGCDIDAGLVKDAEDRCKLELDAARKAN